MVQHQRGRRHVREPPLGRETAARCRVAAVALLQRYETQIWEQTGSGGVVVCTTLPADVLGSGWSVGDEPIMSLRRLVESAGLVPGPEIPDGEAAANFIFAALSGRGQEWEEGSNAF